MAEELPPSRRNLDDVVKKLSELNDNTLRMKAAIDKSNEPPSIRDLIYEHIPAGASETKNTNRTLKQADKIEKNTAKGARAKAIDDRVQTEMDIKQTNENRDKIAADSKKVLEQIAGEDKNLKKALNNNAIKGANDNAEGVMESNTKSSDATKKARVEAKQAEDTLLEILDKQAHEAQEKRETELEAQIENGNLTGEQLEILRKVESGAVKASDAQRQEASLIIKKFEEEDKKLLIAQRIANKTAAGIDKIAKEQFYRNKIAEAEAEGRVEDAKLLRAKIKDETPEDKEARQQQQKTFTKITSGIQDMGKNLGDFLGNMGQKAKGGAFMALKAFGAGALLIGLIKFLESDYFDKFLDAVKGFMGFIDAIGEFLGPGGQLIVILGTLFAILNPIKTGVFLFKGATLLAGLFKKGGGISNAIGKLTTTLGGKTGKIFGFVKNIAGKFAGLFSKGGGVSKGISNLTSSMSGKFGFAKTAAGKFAGLFGKGGSVAKGLTGITGTIGKTFGAGGKLGSGLASGLGKFTGMFAKGGGLLSGLGGIAGTVAKFAGPVGLAVTAGKALFDGASAGIEEYKKSGDMGAALREGLAGAASGLTFGLVSQETISGGLQAIGDAAGSVADGIAGLFKSDAEKEEDKLKAKQERLQKEMDEYQNASLLEQKAMDERMKMQSDGRFKTHAAYIASLQVQTEDQLADIERQRVESGDASKGFLGSLGQGMKNYYSFLGGLVPDGVKDIGKGILDFGKNLFGAGDDEAEKETSGSPERQQLEQDVKVVEDLAESSGALREKVGFTADDINAAKGGGKKRIALRKGIKNTIADLMEMKNSDNYNDKIIATDILDQIDLTDSKPGDGIVQFPTTSKTRMKAFAQNMFNIIDAVSKEDIIAVTDAKEVLRDFDLGQKIADMEVKQAEGEEKAGDIRAILQDGVVSKVEEQQLREAGVKDRFFSGTETEAKDEIARLTQENAKRAEEIAMLKAEREGRNEMGNMLMSPTSNIVNNQTRNITPAPIVNPSSPYGVNSRNAADFN